MMARAKFAPIMITSSAGTRRPHPMPMCPSCTGTGSFLRESSAITRSDRENRIAVPSRSPSSMHTCPTRSCPIGQMCIGGMTCELPGDQVAPLPDASVSVPSSSDRDGDGVADFVVNIDGNHAHFLNFDLSYLFGSCFLVLGSYFIA